MALVGRLEERDQLRFINEAGVKKTIVELQNAFQETYDSLNDTWSNNVLVFKDTIIGEGKVNISYERANEITGIAETRYGLVDENSKININTASMSVIERFFKSAIGLDEGEAQELAASIVDWRDSDSELSIPLGSAEDSYYRNLRYAYEAKDADFDVLDEVLLVKGMTEEIFTKIKDDMTIYGNGKVNINTAPRAVLLALGISSDIVDKIIHFRYGEDGILGTLDDGTFDTPANVVPKLSQATHLSDSDISQLSTIVDQNLTTQSENFMIQSAAQLNNRKKTAMVTSVVNREGKILYWQEL